MTARRSNLDSTGMRLVRKGATVRVFRRRMSGRVLKVRLGQCVVHIAGWKAATPHWCSEVEVVA